jgi:Family of unknown function (DUF5681)
LADALNKTVVVTIDGRRRKLTKREAIVTQMVDKSASADLRATKMLIDMMKTSSRGPATLHRRPNPAGCPRQTRRWLRRQVLREIEEGPLGNWLEIEPFAETTSQVYVIMFFRMAARRHP